MALIMIIAFVIALIAYRYLSIPRYLPPGPWNLPIIGYYLHWDQVHRKFADLGLKYGPVCSFYRFNQLAVVINDYELIKECLLKKGDSFVGKLDNSYALREFRLKEGLLYVDGARWREQRRFSLSTLRDLGVGRPILERSILDEIQYMISVIKMQAIQKHPWNPQSFLQRSVANVICKLIFGKRYDYEDSNFNRLVDTVTTVTSKIHLGALVGFQSWFRYLPKLRRIWKRSLRNQKSMYDTLERVMNEHEISNSHEINDYIDAFKMQQKLGYGDHFNDAQLLYAIRDLFAAGLDTTSSTLSWAILLCAIHPNVQTKCQLELDAICESNAELTLQNRTRTPYVEATLMEIQRYTNVIPFLSRRSTKEVQLGSYSIPEGTAVFCNLWSVHTNEQYFPRADQFDPNRFIDPSTRSVIRHEQFLPFGLGKRVCMGESLARMELYLIFASLLRHFAFRLPDGSKPNLNAISAVTLRPYPYEVLVHIRSHDKR